MHLCGHVFVQACECVRMCMCTAHVWAGCAARRPGSDALCSNAVRRAERTRCQACLYMRSTHARTHTCGIVWGMIGGQAIALSGADTVVGIGARLSMTHCAGLALDFCVLDTAVNARAAGFEGVYVRVPHACMHAYTHARTVRARTHAHAHATHTCTPPHTLTHARTHARTHAYTRTHACTHARSRARTQARTLARTLAR